VDGGCRHYVGHSRHPRGLIQLFPAKSVNKGCGRRRPSKEGREQDCGNSAPRCTGSIWEAKRGSNAALLAQSKFADRAAELARRSADVAIAANKIAANATTLSERAWLSVSVGEQTGNFAIAMRNTGKSPALNVAYLATFKAGKRGVIPDADLRINPEAPTIPPDAPKEMLDILRKEGYIKEHAPTGFVIAPGDIQIASSYGGKFSQIFSLTGDRTYIQGRITYDDIFGKAHETVFCYWFEQPSTFVMCNDHNKMN